MTIPEIKEGCLAWLETVWDRSTPSTRMEFLNEDEDSSLIQNNSYICDLMITENRLDSLSETIGNTKDFSEEVIYSFWREKNGI